jgi:hypothetical protein
MLEKRSLTFNLVLELEAPAVVAAVADEGHLHPVADRVEVVGKGLSAVVDPLVKKTLKFWDKFMALHFFLIPKFIFRIVLDPPDSPPQVLGSNQ